MTMTLSAMLEDAPDAGFSLVDLLLKEQQQLTAVDRFSQLHDRDALPLQTRYYSALMPFGAPQAGEQYAFEVDLDSCSGCKACVTACHSLNGLDDQEIWRDVGLLHGGSAELPIVQHVTTACHHCLEPACLSACPVNAYEKVASTGIVRHLDDQCIGCQYCVLACPYDVPKYNKKKGIVRKCDMCSQRIAVGEAPACVQACPHQAIRIKIVKQQDVLLDCESGAFLPGAPDPQYTLPTTNYVTGKPLPRNTLPADYYSVKREHGHLPLVLMLVLTQLSVGAFLVDLLLDSHIGLQVRQLDGIGSIHALGALLFGLLALGASIFHLGRPQFAFRAFLGLKHSWLSREIVAFAVFAKLAMMYAALDWFWPAADGTQDKLQMALGSTVVAAGMLGVFCSVMVYQVTRRPFWNGTNVSVKFFLTTFLLGIATALLTAMIAAALSGSLSASQTMPFYGAVLCRCLLAAAAAKLAFELLGFLHLGAKQNTSLKRTARLMTGELGRVTCWRFGLGILGGIALPVLLLASEGLSDAAIAGSIMALFAALLIGEVLERYLFFTASVAPRMPGGLTS